MNETRGACEACRESIEGYVTGELDEAQARQVAFHLAECEECAAHYAARRDLIEALRAVPAGLEPVARVLVPVGRGADSRGLAWWRTAAVSAAALAALSITALTMPVFAAQIPVLPVSARLAQLEEERDDLKATTEALSDRVEELEIEVKQIGGESVPVVDSAPGAVPPEVNDAVQRLAMDFIRAQYRGDKAALLALSTARLAAEIQASPDVYLKQPGDVVFAQMTTVGKAEDGTLLVFVRLSDAEFADSTFQEDFEVKLEDGKYLVDFMGMDA